MAKLYPELDIIKKNKPYPTEGELTLINKLKDELDDNYNIYFQPFLDGDNPDIIILNETGGVYIIEVKDWKLEYYKFSSSGGSFGEFRLVTNNCVIGNPFQQVTKYKDNIFGMHIEELFMEKERNPSIFGQLVRVGVYFHEDREDTVKKKFSTSLYNVKYIDKWGYNSNISKDIKKFLDKDCYYMNRELYKEFDRLFQPAFHSLDQGINMYLTDQQNKLAESKPNCNVKIKGVAGSGKTLVLAKRAVSATKRTGNRVLILTYNITLRNYIRDRISKIRENFTWDKFYIINYHSFISKEIKRLNGSINIDTCNDVVINKILEANRGVLDKYDTILIDEGQDFEKIWFENIKQNFLAENGEFVIFADEKQNIYNRELEADKKTSTNIIGRWNELKQSFRIGQDISRLAMKYQKSFFKDKYEIDEIYTEQINLLDNKQDIKYVYNEDITYLDVFEEVRKYVKENGIHNNHACIVATEIEPLRELEYVAREKYQFRFERTIETKEEYEHITQKSRENVEEKLEALRRIRKKHFYLDSGKMKISTIHSFKGWEIDTLVVIIDKSDEESNKELIYTALTRCKKNLLVYNRGDRELDKFFKDNI